MPSFEDIYFAALCKKRSCTLRTCSTHLKTVAWSISFVSEDIIVLSISFAIILFFSGRVMKSEINLGVS